LKPSNTVYHKWGKGGKRILLRFSKTGAPALEAAYSRHYVATIRDHSSTGTLDDAGDPSIPAYPYEPRNR
jgi:hypothetical protein